MNRKRIAVVLVAVAGTLGGASLAYSTDGPNAKLVHQDRIYGGGGTEPGCYLPDINFCRPGPTDFAIDAHATGNGHAAYGDVVFLTRHEQVTCVAVAGSNAVVGGIFVSDPDPSRVGWLFVQFFVDNGTFAFGGDFASPQYIGPAEPSSGWPRGFPYVCPSPDTGAPDFGMIRSFLPISRGDIVIQDATRGGGDN